MITDTIYFEYAPWGAGRYRKIDIPPMQCIYEKDLPLVKTPSKWTDSERVAVQKHFALNQAKQRMVK